MLRLSFQRLAFISILAVFSLIIGLKTSVAIFYLLFSFILALILLSLACIAAGYFGAKLEFNRSVITKIEEDDSVEIKMAVTNASFIPLFNLLFEDNLSCAEPGQMRRTILIDFLGPGASRSINYSCVCPKRGKFALGPAIIYFFDPFGLFCFKKVYPAFSDIYVYPRTFPITKFPPLVKGVLPWFGIETSHTSGDEDEFFGVRAYKEGDPIKRIHWLSSARKNALIVKQFQRQNFFRATIIFNLERSRNYGEGKESVAEYIVRIAASVAKYLINNNVAVEIIAQAGEIVHIPFNKGPEYLEDVMKFFTVAKPESEVSLIEIFQEHARHVADSSSLVVIMLDKDWEHFSAMLSLDKRNVCLIPLIVMSSTFNYAFDKKEVIIDAMQKVSRWVNFNPIIFSKGDRLEEAFLR
ncbi:MAG: DUF58 domain-containing protein [Candidatus Omnitrophota bacterium]